jgi:hypothetical protein
MEPARDPDPDPYDPIEEILQEASCLSAARILELSTAYPRDPEERQARTHMLEVAAARDGRHHEYLSLRGRAANAVRLAAATSHALPLGRFGILTEAEFAVQDAVLAILLADRLGPDQVARLSRPWLESR